jgi:hypothetical protein
VRPISRNKLENNSISRTTFNPSMEKKSGHRPFAWEIKRPRRAPPRNQFSLDGTASWQTGLSARGTQIAKVCLQVRCGAFKMHDSIETRLVCKELPLNRPVFPEIVDNQDPSVNPRWAT